MTPFVARFVESSDTRVTTGGKIMRLV